MNVFPSFILAILQTCFFSILLRVFVQLCGHGVVGCQNCGITVEHFCRTSDGGNAWYRAYLGMKTRSGNCGKPVFNSDIVRERESSRSIKDQTSLKSIKEIFWKVCPINVKLRNDHKWRQTLSTCFSKVCLQKDKAVCGSAVGSALLACFSTV